MDIRILQEHEIPMASSLAMTVYERCVAPYGIGQDMAQAFYEYNTPGLLVNRARSGQLVVWGSFQDNQLVAVSALQPEGHITMLYVLPQFAHRSIGTALIKEMAAFAKKNLNVDALTVNAMPVWSADFFVRNGFVAYADVEPGLAFIPMYRKLRRELSYEKRPFPQKAAIIMGSLLVVISIVLAFGYMLSR
ncbi:MAG: GNAT family N-acetyltransferase [Clostridiales bacterium]|nr:GNAT family N-acetyltransferase [Clostridiales bacterium]